MIVKVKRIKTDPWLGIKKYPGTTIEKIPVGLDSKTGDLKYIFSGKEEQAKFERDLSLEAGTLNRNSPYWIEYFVQLDIENSFDTDIASDALSLKVLESKKIIAKSIEELKRNPYAEYVIYKEVEEAKANNKDRKKKKEAYGIYSKMTLGEMTNVLTALGMKPDNTEPDVIEDALGNIVESNPERFLLVAKNEDLDLIVFLNKLKNKGIISYRAKAYTYGEYRMGELQEAINFLKNADYADVYLSLQKQLKEDQE